MTPKEKALDLVSNFKTITPTDMYCGNDWKMSKECALIVVDEILDLGYVPKEKSSFNVYKYYCEVKLEINKL